MNPVTTNDLLFELFQLQQRIAEIAKILANEVAIKANEVKALSGQVPIEAALPGTGPGSQGAAAKKSAGLKPRA